MFDMVAGGKNYHNAKFEVNKLKNKKVIKLLKPWTQCI